MVHKSPESEPCTCRRRRARQRLNRGARAACARAACRRGQALGRKSSAALPTARAARRPCGAARRALRARTSRPLAHLRSKSHAKLPVRSQLRILSQRRHRRGLARCRRPPPQPARQRVSRRRVRPRLALVGRDAGALAAFTRRRLLSRGCRRRRVRRRLSRGARAAGALAAVAHRSPLIGPRVPAPTRPSAPGLGGARHRCARRRAGFCPPPQPAGPRIPMSTCSLARRLDGARLRLGRSIVGGGRAFRTERAAVPPSKLRSSQRCAVGRAWQRLAPPLDPSLTRRRRLCAAERRVGRRALMPARSPCVQGQGDGLPAAAR